jgi:RNA-directed DNA polymerase
VKTGMTDGPKTERRVSASQGATQASEIHGELGTPAIATGLARWTWVESAVWTTRMLDALNKGVKGGKWFSLWDKVWSRENLAASFKRVKRNGGAAGIDGITVATFEKDLLGNLGRLAQALRAGTYAPAGVRRTHIPKGPGSKETRPLGIPTVRDRVVQGALRSVLEPIFERDFAAHSYGFRPKHSTKDALRRVQALLNKGHTWVVDADIKAYFDSIPHDRLMALVEAKISDGQVVRLLRAYLTAKVFDDGEEWTPCGGTPQGAIISPLLANIYLNPLDQKMDEEGREMVRYADDFVILCQTREEAERVLEAVAAWVSEAGLTLHPEKTRIADATEKGGGFDFLGYHFECGKRWPRKKSIEKLKTTIRLKTKRTTGDSMAKIITDLNQTLRGWFEYFKHSAAGGFPKLDGFTRRRLRALLLKRHKAPRHGDGSANMRWQNAYFDELGLYNLTRARQLAVQSARQ